MLTVVIHNMTAISTIRIGRRLLGSVSRCRGIDSCPLLFDGRGGGCPVLVVDGAAVEVTGPTTITTSSSSSSIDRVPPQKRLPPLILGPFTRQPRHIQPSCRQILRPRQEFIGILHIVEFVRHGPYLVFA